jgi:glycosyltransferase involved in cell wall biosynthesis
LHIPLTYQIVNSLTSKNQFLKRIIFINQDSGYLMIDIINTYAIAGYKCVLITGRLVIRNRPLFPGVKVEKIIQYDRMTITRRLLTWFIGFIQILWKIITRYRRDDLFIVSNPPFAPLLPILLRNPVHLLIYDIFPDVLVESGYLSNKSALIKWWQKFNRKAFVKARNIFTITNGMKMVLQNYALNKTIEVVPIWTDNTFLKPIDPDINPFIKKHNLSGKFIVMYSGNLGLSADVEILMDIALEINRNDIVFLIIGDGIKKDGIREKVSRLGLTNLVLLPWQPTEELPYSLASANIGVIFLGNKLSKLAIPSKLYNFLSVGSPLLCITPKGSEIESIVRKYKCGNSFEPDNIKGMANFVSEVADNIDFYSSLKMNSLKASEDYGISKIDKFLATTG